MTEGSPRYSIMGGRKTAKAVAALAMLLVALVLLSSGCAQSVAEFYSDFLLNEDIMNRFGVCFADIENGHAGVYTIGELRALGQDLEYGYRTGDEDAQQATRLLQGSAAELILALEEDDPLESTHYENALDLFEEGWRISIDVRQGAYDDE